MLLSHHVHGVSLSSYHTASVFYQNKKKQRQNESVVMDNHYRLRHLTMETKMEPKHEGRVLTLHLVRGRERSGKVQGSPESPSETVSKASW